MGVKIDDANTKVAVSGTEKIPVSGANNPAITPDLLKTFLGTWTDYVPSFTGFSVNPGVDIAKYCKIGNLCFVVVSLTSGTSTSNSTGFTITLPFNSAFAMTSVFDNPVDASLPVAAGLISLSAGSNVATLLKEAGATWTNSGQKRGRFTLFYITE